MIKTQLNKKSLLIIATCVTAVCILFLGMRVPDISRPQRPKQSHRAFIEKQVKTSQHVVKKTVEFFAVPARAAEPSVAVRYRTHRLLSFKAVTLPPLFPNLSRAPPAHCS